jgi:hypothetical protein
VTLPNPTEAIDGAYFKLYTDLVTINNCVIGRYDSFNSPVKEAILEKDRPIPLFPSSV